MFVLLTMANPSKSSYSAVSAPGKVLLAGGYLVLDREYTGLVFGLSARIHVIVKEAVTAEGAEPLIVVKSPQFIEAEWRYSTAILGEGAGVAVKQLERYVMRFYFMISLLISSSRVILCSLFSHGPLFPS